jgi:hypothetical protein
VPRVLLNCNLARVVLHCGRVVSTTSKNPDDSKVWMISLLRIVTLRKAIRARRPPDVHRRTTDAPIHATKNKTKHLNRAATQNDRVSCPGGSTDASNAMFCMAKKWLLRSLQLLGAATSASASVSAPASRAFRIRRPAASTWERTQCGSSTAAIAAGEFELAVDYLERARAW